MSSNTFNAVLTKFRNNSFSQRDKGFRFERLMQLYLKTTSLYAGTFKEVWMWDEFPSRGDFGGKDTGIDLVALTHDQKYWAIQCKCYSEKATIHKAEVDSFLSTSSKTFFDSDTGEELKFTHGLWISTTNKWGANAELTIQNQNPPISRLSLSDLEKDAVDWHKLENGLFGESAKAKQHDPKEHQLRVINNAHDYFKTRNRGKVIMACGTGKTFTSLKIAEKETGSTGLILFLVPSIALVGQTLREWTSQAKEPITPICICSDARISQSRKKDDDNDEVASIINLALPATTNVADIVKQLKSVRSSGRAGMTVVFSTYQSIEVISKAQKLLQGEEESESGIFDLIICDEAHRTTGVTLKNTNESAFVKVHDNEFLMAHKRMYMTATPRLYSEDMKTKAAQSETVLCSMDDEAIYGAEIDRIGFGEAVEKGLLSDYKVLILTVSEKDISPTLLKSLMDGNELKTDDASKMVGCINALSKRLLGDANLIRDTDPLPMRRAVAFTQSIKVSQATTRMFNECKAAYYDDLDEADRGEVVEVFADHIDGSMSAPQRDEKLAWLKAHSENERECRMLTNVRCLSEGVDVPSLDAVLFLSERNSQVDVVQTVGRVMRKAEGKKYGYIIIPVIVPPGMDANEAMDKTDRFKVVWSVLNALRAHDDRFNAIVNKIELNKYKPAQILIGGIDYDRESGGGGSGSREQLNEQFRLQFEELQNTFYAKVVQKVGDKRYWEQWAKDVAKIAEQHIAHIKELISEEGQPQRAFNKFLTGLRKNLNPSVSEADAIEMLSQHIITRPVFEALFEDYSFVQNNAISKSMQKIMALLEERISDDDNEKLEKFYDSVRKRAADIDNAEAKQKVIIELYDKFFKSAFPLVVEKLGIVYTPLEVVDFIIHSIEAVLKKEFSRSLSDENVHILDPFTGTGTFVTRLLQSGLIAPKDLERKYRKEIHANEIVLLAYYIAAVNIENTFHDLLKEENRYMSFDGICLTDTFQLGESDTGEKLFSEIFPQNSNRVIEQQKAPLRVIMGNPPYSIGQKSANDNAQNQSYAKLDAKIATTYAKGSKATSVKALYDSYIKAFRWSTDRLDPKNGGVVAFVSNGAWLDGNGMDGFRKCLEKDFSSIYVFNLRGNQRTSGELSRQEGGKIFGSGSRTPIAITLLVKKPKADKSTATIHYHDIGDYLNRDEKLGIIKGFKSIEGIQWKVLQPNEHGDWLNQRNDTFGGFIPLAPDKKFDVQTKSVFTTYSLGLATGRDAWVYNFSKKQSMLIVERMIHFYNEQTSLYQIEKIKNEEISVDSFLNLDPTKFSWNRNQKEDLQKGKVHTFHPENFTLGFYRPFCKNNLYFDKDFNAMLYMNRRLFPNPGIENKVICVSGLGGNKSHTTLMSEAIVDLNFLEAGAQCFPMYHYEERPEEKNKMSSLFDEAETEDRYIRHDGVSDFILNEAQVKYGTNKIRKEDIFYYVYGILHSEKYRTLFAADLKKMLPRLPLVDKVQDFWTFSNSGRQLAELHLNYETIQSYEGVTIQEEENAHYVVEKMRFGKVEKEVDKSVIYYNGSISIHNIPLKAYSYVVNGKSAIEWIMERYQVTVNKDSQIKNDPNDWAIEHNDERYIFNLLLRIINVSMQTVDIVGALPKIEFAE